MARPIDGDALKRRCEKIIDQACHPATVQIGEVFLDKVRSIPTLTLPNEWVSVEERLPTDERPVLVFIGYADTMTGFITTSSYFCFDANPHWQWDGLTQDEQKTLFWMSLPEPPTAARRREKHERAL